MTSAERAGQEPVVNLKGHPAASVFVIGQAGVRGVALFDDRDVAWAVIARRIRRQSTTVSREN